MPVDQVVLPAFSIENSPKKTVAWDHPISPAEAKEATPLLNEIGKLLKTVSGIQLVSTYLKMRVWPLRLRAHPMWQYEGPLDSIRMSTTELTQKELSAQVKKITSIKASAKIDINFPHVPYGPEKALPAVSDSFCRFYASPSAFAPFFAFVLMIMDCADRKSVV